MAPTSARENASPSASSIFLPLGRRGRGDSKSSLSNPVDQDALNQALNTIHTAASQSQDLTVFNEYTDPPVPAVDHDNKGIAGEIQGSLSGLYNKLIGSVGVTKDVVDTRAAEAPQERGQGKAGQDSKSGSVAAIRIQLPSLQAYEPTPASAAPLKSPQISLKSNLASSKNSGGTTPALKSPPGGLHKTTGLVAEPIVSESNVIATSNSTLHSRNTSQHDGPVQSIDQTVEGDSLRRVLSRSSAMDDPSVDRRLISPTIRPLSPVDRHQLTRRMHERGISESSNRSRREVGIDGAGGNLESQSGTRPPLNRPEVPSHSNGTVPDASRFLADNAVPISRSSTRVDSPHSPRSPRSPASQPVREIIVRSSQPRLPGFDLTQASSTDSSIAAVQTSRKIPGLDGGTSERPSAAPPPRVSFTLPRSKLLSKEYWMRDENARDCFHCGEPFSTFRRKHHCRTCGQIFDHKCTSTVPGGHFGSANAVRVCKPCEAIIASRDDDSSDYSIEEIALPEPVNRPHTPLDQKLARDSPRFDDDNASIYSQSLEQMAKTPTMNFPVRRAIDSNNRNSAILEFDSNRPLPRPGSSRSLRTAISHPHITGHGHKRHNSRHQYVRNFKAYHEERAPFQKRLPDESSREGKQSAFHKDGIVDPELAQYLSDDASSDDEQSVDANFEESKLSRSGPDSDKATIGGLLAAVRKGRSRFADKSIASLLAGRDADDVSITSTRPGGQSRANRKRNLSVSSTVHQKLTPKQNKDGLYITSPANRDHQRSGSPFQMIPMGSARMMRSASMRGATAPSMELNTASIQHVRKLLQQLLKDSDVPRQSSWEAALIPILLRVTDDVDTDVQNGDDMDMRHYVKLKKILGGKPGDTAYISGLVFTKNLALKSMPRSIPGPRILIITFPLEYARYEQHFMSLDPVIRQEREYLENLIGRIAALQPDLLLAQRNVSGLALELLDKAKIATAYNVKATNLEAVSRFTQSRIIYSVDQLTAPHGTLGTCENFEVKTYVAEGRKKTYMYLSGCPPGLGCTVTIRGADRGTLVKVKKITEFMVYVVYNLKLETCLMRDEWALIPSQSSDVAQAPPKIASAENRATITALLKPDTDLEKGVSEGSDVHEQESAVVEMKQIQNPQPTPAERVETADSTDIPDDIPVPTFYEDLVEKHQSKILSASPFVKFAQPYLLTRARELERRVAYLKRLRDQDAFEVQSSEEKAKAQKFTLIQPEMIHSSLAGTGKKVREVLHALHDTEYDKALHNYDSQKKQWEAYLSGNRNLFDPFAHQNIAVLYSVVSTETSIPCHGPDVIAFAFYHEHDGDDKFEADSTLGQVVESLCHTADDMCPWDACEKRLFEHHRQYVHGEAQVSVFVQPYPSKMRGMQNTILMWSQCKKCGIETPVIPMSASTWKYSFGKYLELSFWSADLHARAGICPHDLHRDHLRYFGYKDFALRIHYDPVELLEIIVPRLRITWKVENDLKFRNEVYTKIEHRLTRFMVSVKLRLKSINAEALLPENAEACAAEIEKMTKRANDEHSMLVKQLQECYTNSKHWETTPLNRVVRSTIEKQGEWENTFLEFEKNFFPSEKDIRRLATLQLKKIFLDSDVSVTSLGSAEEGTISPPSEDFIDEKGSMSDPDSQASKLRKGSLSPEKTAIVLQSVVEEHLSPNGHIAAPQGDAEPPNTVAPLNLLAVPRDTKDVQHLDLALPEDSASRVTLEDSENYIMSTSNTSSAPIRHGSKDSSDDHPPLIVVQSDTGAARSEEGFTKPIDLPRPSGIPRAIESSTRVELGGKLVSPTLLRSQSQPAGSAALRREQSSSSSSTLLAINATHGFGSTIPKPGELQTTTTEPGPRPGEKKLSERLGLHHLKGTKFAKGQSFIPRSIASRKDSRVSNLAKHFEQLSREFEKERVRERKLRASKNRQSRAYPLVTSKPIVEVYKSVDEAVEEKDSSYGDLAKEAVAQMIGETAETVPGMARTDVSATAGDGFHGEETPAELTENEVDQQETSRAASDIDGDDNQSDSDDLGESIQLPESPEDLLRLSQEDLDLKELPKHERTSLMKLLQNFWAERSSSGWTPLEYPLAATDHVFADCDIIVREDEPSSIIAFALSSDDYKSMLFDIRDRHKSEKHDPDTIDGVQSPAVQADVMHSLLRKTGTHLKYQFQQGPAKMTCKIFFAEQFDAVRRKCGIAEHNRIIESLSRCMKWDSKGGKTKSLFLKTSDDRFVLKSLSQIETQSFLKFAPNYFQIMSEAFFHELPSVIAKMLGFYQIIVSNKATGVEYAWNLLLMENLFYDRTPTRIFDLKGSMRNRKIQSTGERNEVLLDENMVEFIYESPLFAREHAKKVLRSSVHNDTLFLARQNVMDYSLMVAIDEKRKELVVGIIDCIRTYTWDKKLESWIKDRGFAGGNKNRPTVTSPKEYKKRFREAMVRYVLEAPNCWYQFKGVERRVVKVNGQEGQREGGFQVIS
jgi:1-phosphatidylinositol-3-phosphate 5-kinase